MDRFEQRYPTVAAWLRQKKAAHPDRQEQGISHWLMLGTLAALTAADFRWQLLGLVLIVALTALFRGPGMLLAAACYAAVIGFFPPLGLVLTAVFFLLSLWQLQKSWRFYLFAGVFYSWPLGVSALEAFGVLGSDRLTIAVTVGLALLWGHLSLTALYHRGLDSRSLALALFQAPFDFLLLFLPRRVKSKIAPDFTSARRTAVDRYSKNTFTTSHRKNTPRVFFKTKK